MASRSLRDPHFSETVVLLIRYDKKGAMGVIINVPTEVKLNTVLPEIEALRQRPDQVYLGGPVARHRMLLLIRASSRPEESQHVFADIYLSSSRNTLQQMIANPDSKQRFRVYAGYAGWAPGQLDREVSRGDWHILPANTEIIFDKPPAEIWPELIRKSTLRWLNFQESDRRRPGQAL